MKRHPSEVSLMGVLQEIRIPKRAAEEWEVDERPLKRFRNEAKLGDVEDLENLPSIYGLPVENPPMDEGDIAFRGPAIKRKRVTFAGSHQVRLVNWEPEERFNVDYRVMRISRRCPDSPQHQIRKIAEDYVKDLTFNDLRPVL